jgi:hypothetical protein
MITMAQEQRVKVHMKDGSITEGRVLKVSAEGVEIDPGGTVKFRFIDGERISKVEFIGTGKTVEYPLKAAELPPEIALLDRGSTGGTERGFPKFVGIASFGYASAGNSGYYEGFHAGSTVHVGLQYLFRNPDPQGSRMLMGLSYNRISVAGDKIFGAEPQLVMNVYGFEFGLTTAMMSVGQYLYLIMGGAIVTNTITMPMGVSQASITVEADNKAALRIEGGMHHPIVSNLSVRGAIGADFIIEGTGNANAYGSTYSNRTLNGWLPKITIGMSYGFR